MSAVPDRSEQERFAQYWDAIARGLPETGHAALGDGLDPEMIALIARMRELGQASRPDPTFRHRLEHHLMHASTLPPTLTLPLPGARPVAANGHAAAPLPGPGQARQRSRATWPVIATVVAVAVVLTLVSSLGILPRQSPDHAAAPGVAPLVQAPSPAPDWPMYKGNPARTGEMLGPGPEGQPVEVWRSQAGGPASRSPAIANGLAYVQSGDGVVAALDAESGAVRWQAEVAGAGENTPTVNGGTVYVTTQEGALVALDAGTGAERWRFAEAVSADSTPVIVDGALYIGGDGVVFALDAASGTESWQSSIDAPVGRSLAVSGGMVYAPTTNGHLFALEAATGEQRWEFDGHNEEEMVFSPTVANGMVYVIHAGVLRALDAGSGAEQWQKTYEGARPLSAAGGLLVSGGLDGIVYAVDAATGAERWTYQTGDRIQASPAIVGDTVYIGSFDRNLYALDLRTGAEQWVFALDGVVDYGPSVANGKVYVGTDAGSIYAIGGSGLGQVAAPVASTPVAATPVATASGAASVAWSIPGGRGAFRMANFLAVDPDGNVWVPDGAHSRFLIYSPDGELREVWGEPGSGEGQFNFNHGDYANMSVAFRPDGGFYVADSQNHRIQQFDADRTFVRAWGSAGTGDGQFYRLIGATLDAEGNVYATDWGRDDVQKFSAEGEFLGTISSKGHDPGQLFSVGWGDVAPDGTLWIADTYNNRIQQFALDGAFLQAVGGLGSAPGKFKEPETLTIDDAGRIFVSDGGNDRIQVFNPDGSLLAVLDGTGGGGEPFAYPLGIAVDSAGALYVETLDGGEKLLKYDLAPPLAP